MTSRCTPGSTLIGIPASSSSAWLPHSVRKSTISPESSRIDDNTPSGSGKRSNVARKACAPLPTTSSSVGAVRIAMVASASPHRVGLSSGRRAAQGAQLRGEEPRPRRADRRAAPLDDGVGEVLDLVVAQGLVAADVEAGGVDPLGDRELARGDVDEVAGGVDRLAEDREHVPGLDAVVLE